MFSLVAMPNIISVYRSVSVQQITILIVFGAGWGVGAILFGVGMDKLGMALGYPIIMGLVASLGALIPLTIFFPKALFTARGLVLLVGTAIVVCGIVLCSLAGARKKSRPESASGALLDAITPGLIIAILAGVFSSLPNVGVAFGTDLIHSARAQGTSEALSVNSVWALFFTIGFIVNFGYCLYLILRRKEWNRYFGPEGSRNLGLSALMAIMWIGSFYMYGIGAAKLGRWGIVMGWPLFISLSIGVGNLWGIWRGEWKGAASSGRLLLNGGLFVLLIAIFVIASSNLL
jgi:L-rhamnose-H+ transport protein